MSVTTKETLTAAEADAMNAAGDLSAELDELFMLSNLGREVTHPLPFTDCPAKTCTAGICCPP
jgi:hypothetical protein